MKVIRPTKLIGQYTLSLLVGAMMMFISSVNAAMPDPVDTLKETLTNVTSDISQNAAVYKTDKQKYYSFIDRQIMPIMDVDLFSRAVLGKHSRDASPQQLADFESAFKDFLISSYGEALLQYQGETVDFKPASINEGQRTTAIVDTVLHAEDQDYEVAYKLILDDQGQWKIYDVLFEDLSLGINFRNSYSDIIDRDGLDHLIGLLRGKTAPAPESAPN